MNKLKFKGKTLYRKTVSENIESVLLQGIRPNQVDFQEGFDWYIQANKLATELGVKYNIPQMQVCGVIAALSPLKTWDENQKIAELLLKTGKGKHISRMVQKAKDILSYNGILPEMYIQHTLNGNKIKSFFINIYLPQAKFAVTIDRHAISVALGRSIIEKEGVGISDKQYKFFESCYKEVAEKYNMIPSTVQAITWVKWRNLKKQ